MLRKQKKDLATMEVIVDELKKKGVHVDIETFSEHIEYILGNYRNSYNEAVDRLNSEELILDVFHEMNVNTLSRAMAYLTLVYRTSHLSNKDTTRKAARLAAPILRNVGRVEGGFIRNLCSWGVQRVLNLWDLL